MLVKLFVLGRSGCGKSTAIRHIAELARQGEYDFLHIKDYTILRAMYEKDTKKEKFQPTDWDGFDVSDFSVLDEVLTVIRQQLEELEQKHKNSTRNEIVMIEFARNEYQKALMRIGHKQLQNAYFLFIASDLEVCIERIRYRLVNSPLDQDSHYVSDAIMRSYFRTDNGLQTMFSIKDQMMAHVKILNNDGSLTLKAFERQIAAFAEDIFRDNFYSKQPLNQDAPVLCKILI